MDNTSRVAAFVSERIRVTGKKQVDIAEEAGFEQPNVITMIKQGKTKLPLAKVGTMAKALEADPVYLLKLCVEEYQPDTWEAISPYMEEMVTADELRIVHAIRKGIGTPYLSAMTNDQQKALNAFVDSMQNDLSTLH